MPLDYVADFETTTDIDDCRVWAWCCCGVDDVDSTHYGNDIDTFLSHCEETGGVYYFHNLAFDGEFILNRLLHLGYVQSSKLSTRTFKTLISNTGKFYEIEVCFLKPGKKKMRKVVYKDSLKKLPMPVAEIARAFNLPIRKLDLDYEGKREVGHELTPHEIDYITNDVKIVAMALKQQFDKGLTRLTAGSDALGWYRSGIGNSNWNKLYPKLTLEMDTLIRKAYKGGFTYADPRYQADSQHPDRVQGAGNVYDVNSMYPSVMRYKPLPIGVPLYFRGRYKQNDQYPLYIQFLCAHCKLKPNRIPMLQIKKNPYFIGTEYLTDTEVYVDLALTSVDLDLLADHYDIDVLSYDGGFMFMQQTGLFNDYVDHWMGVKATSTGGARQLAKLMLNSLYGKFATNPDVTPKIPFLAADGSTKYKLGDADTRDPVYTAMGAFITAWARDKIVRSAQAVYERFMYCDTDSIHVLGTEPVEGIEVHPTKLGAWKHESTFSSAKYVRQKTYMERVVKVGKVVEGEYRMVECEPFLDVKCAGLPSELKEKVTFDNFKRGLRLYGKLRPKHVNGGIVLERTYFTLT